ncbi:MAG: hypothetical protein ACM3NQ_07950 [Bacteroidales bacterium]
MTAYLVATVIVVAAALIVVRFAWTYIRLRGTRVVTCPETRQTAAVEIGTAAAAASGVIGRPRFHLNACSHWPEKAGCGQSCLAEIGQAPADCLVRTQLERWYQGKSCAVCRREVGPIDWYDRRPTLLSPENHPLMWQELKAELLYETLRTHKPLCFDCYVAETFRQTHPELVLDNPFASPPPGRA